MKTQSAIGFGIVVLAVGTSLGYFIRPVAEPKMADEPVAAPKKAIATEADAELKALRRQVKILQEQLADARKTAAEGASESARAVEEKNPQGPRDGGDWRARMEQWRKDNPEEFARMEERMKRFREDRARRAKGRLEFLASIDTSEMSAEEKETHEKLQESLARREELESRVGQVMDLPDDERGRLFAEMREMHQTINELNARERTALFRQMAGELGLAGENAELVSSTITEIINATDNGFGGRGPGGFGGRGHGGRGPGGRGGR